MDDTALDSKLITPHSPLKTKKPPVVKRRFACRVGWFRRMVVLAKRPLPSPEGLRPRQAAHPHGDTQGVVSKQVHGFHVYDVKRIGRECQQDSILNPRFYAASNRK